MDTFADKDNVRYKNDLLLARLHSGDESALDELVRANEGLVHSIAMRYADRGTEMCDLVQLGNIGLIRAARGFDFSFNTAFSTYAVLLISGEIKRYLRDDGPVKIGRELRSRACKAAKARAEYISAHGEEPRMTELAKICDMTVEEVSEALCASGGVRSLCERTGDDETSTLESKIEDPNDDISRITDRIALKQAIADLDSMQRAIVELRFRRELSQQETGNILGISQVKVSREERKLLERLRRAL